MSERQHMERVGTTDIASHSPLPPELSTSDASDHMLFDELEPR